MGTTVDRVLSQLGKNQGRIQQSSQPPSRVVNLIGRQVRETQEQELGRRREFEEIVRNRVGSELAAMVLKLWQTLSGRAMGVTKTPLLDVDDEMAMLTWDMKEHHLDIEVNRSGNIEFFYKNRRTGEFWNRDLHYRSGMPEPVVRVFDRLRVD